MLLMLGRMTGMTRMMTRLWLILVMSSRSGSIISSVDLWGCVYPGERAGDSWARVQCEGGADLPGEVRGHQHGALPLLLCPGRPGAQGEGWRRGRKEIQPPVASSLPLSPPGSLITWQERLHSEYASLAFSPLRTWKLIKFPRIAHTPLPTNSNISRRSASTGRWSSRKEWRASSPSWTGWRRSCPWARPPPTRLRPTRSWEGPRPSQASSPSSKMQWAKDHI